MKINRYDKNLKVNGLQLTWDYD